MKKTNIKEAIKKAGLSFTKARYSILEVFHQEHGPFSAEDLLAKLPEELCDRATIYRTLKHFKEKGLLKCVNFDEDFSRYELNDEGHHHHHIICRNCQKIETINSCFLEQIEQNLKEKGYSRLSHNLEFFGLCNSCNQD